MPIDSLPPLRDIIARHGLQAQKALGQNFLFDLNLTSRIARSAGSLEDVTVLEVGPGPGGLTRALLAAGARKVIAIERDPRCIPALEEIAAHYPGRLTIIEGDALTFNPASIEESGSLKIMANLPYNIGTALLMNWIDIENWPPRFDDLVLMFQREVAERIVATPAAPHDYGRLSVFCGWRTDAKILFDVSPQAFTPAPKIISSVVRLTPRAQPLACNPKILARVTQAAFGQRRKMLRQSLKSLGVNPIALCETVGLDPTARAETVTIEEFVALAQVLEGT
ncbi:MAG: 16S rRNA (adenine(1518)-N(6)/adenine(1519)-N(6))-dimethyltransferase RsmA [Alphaproteobacteria bacterium]